MFPGMPTTTAPGDAEGQIDYLTAENIPGGINILCRMRAGYSQYVVFIFDGKIIGAFPVTDDAITTVPVFNDTDGVHTIIALPNGEWPYPIQAACDAAVQYFGLNAARTIHFVVRPTLQYLLPDAVNVVVTATTGAQRNGNLDNDAEGRANWASFDYESVDIGGGDFSLTITARGQTVAYGEGPSGSITADAVDSGLTVTATVTGAESGTCWIRWPVKYGLYWAGNFPTPDAYIQDDGASNVFSYTTPMLDTANYSCYTSQFDDNDNVSTTSGTVSIAIQEYPNPPENLRYVSGNNVSTTIAWDAPATGPTPDEYHVYDSAENAENFLDTFTPTDSTVAFTLALGSSVAPPYTRKIIVRAALLGDIEKNLNILEINYDAAGDYIPPQPNTPTLFGSPNATGQDFSVVASYDPAGQAAAPVTIDLFAWPADGAADWTTVYGQYTFATAPTDTEFVTIDATGLPFGDELVYFGLRAVAADSTTDGNENVLGPVELTTTGTAAPAAEITPGA